MSMSAASAAVSAPENTALFSLNADGGAREGASGGFALLPLAIAEGILGVLVFRLLTDVARPELERLGVIKPSMSEAVAR